jgi:GntR family transcriptional repressor for pyruvate dehydrogenase complex
MIEKALLKRPVQSKTEQVIESLAELILTGDLENNAILPAENEMCRRLGVSRSIFREAMKILGAKGLVEVRQGFGTIVKAPGEDVPAEALSNFIHLNQISLFQVMEVRGPMDVEIARLAARRRKKKHIEAMEATLDVMKASRGDHDAFIQADHDFHRILVTATENPLFIILVRSVEKFVKYLRTVTYQFGTEKVLREHKAILEAVKSGNADAAGKAMEVHMEATIKDLRRLYRENKAVDSEAMRKAMLK